MTPQELLKPRYKVIADYPHNRFKINDILTWIENTEYFGEKIQVNAFGKFINETLGSAWVDHPEHFPTIFKQLEWWQERTIEQLQAVKFVKVIKYVGYWREGDIVPTEGFRIGSLEKSKPYGYVLKYNHWHPIFNVIPATEEEYKQFRGKEKLNQL